MPTFTLSCKIDAKVETTITNSLWPDDDALIKADFIQRNQDYYAAEVQRLDYVQAGAHKIIKAGRKQTKGKIKELLMTCSRIHAWFWLIPYFNGNGEALRRN